MGRLLLGLVLAIVVAGCGGAGEPSAGDEGGGSPAVPAAGDPEAGAGVFAEAGCGNCHALEAAGTTAAIGPDLDETEPSFAEALEQIEDGGGGMPAYEGDLTDEQIRDVASFVAEATRR